MGGPAVPVLCAVLVQHWISPRLSPLIHKMGIITPRMERMESFPVPGRQQCSERELYSAQGRRTREQILPTAGPVLWNRNLVASIIHVFLYIAVLDEPPYSLSVSLTSHFCHPWGEALSGPSSSLGHSRHAHWAPAGPGFQPSLWGLQPHLPVPDPGVSVLCKGTAVSTKMPVFHGHDWFNLQS